MGLILVNERKTMASNVDRKRKPDHPCHVDKTGFSNG